MSTTPGTDFTIAVYLDLENIVLGARDANYPKFDIRNVVERLLLKGHIVVKKAYCDFGRYDDFKRGLHEAAFELIDIPHVRQSGKNSADIRMVVDALDLCYTKGHVDTFAIISGDSDFSPLVSKLRENAKTVIGVGVKNSTSDLFINNCDEFIYYDDLVRSSARKAPRPRRHRRQTMRRRHRRRPAITGGRRPKRRLPICSKPWKPSARSAATRRSGVQWSRPRSSGGIRGSTNGRMGFVRSTTCCSRARNAGYSK